jgi:hypothetical protein
MRPKREKPMPKRFSARQLVAALAAAAGLATLAGCALPPPPSLATAAPVPPGEARVWFYRDVLTPELPALPAIAMNGHVVGVSIEGGSFYRDVPAGDYHITVASYGRDLYQAQNVALVPGEQAYVKIQSLPDWEQHGVSFDRNTFYVTLVAPPLAQFELAQTAYYGGS